MGSKCDVCGLDEGVSLDFDAPRAVVNAACWRDPNEQQDPQADCYMRGHGREKARADRLAAAGEPLASFMALVAADLGPEAAAHARALLAAWRGELS